MGHHRLRINPRLCLGVCLDNHSPFTAKRRPGWSNIYVSRGHDWTLPQHTKSCGDVKHGADCWWSISCTSTKSKCRQIADVEEQWISEFAPRSIQRLLSYIVGWLTVLGWQVGLSSVSYAAALQLESLAILVHPSIVFQAWHATLFTIAIALIAVLFNTVLVEKLPVFEFVVLILHIAAYIAFEVVLLTMGPQSTREEVFGQWENSYDWPNLSTAVLVGIIAPVTTLTSADSICHLAEELKDASKWLPRCMVGAAALNFTIAFLMLITVLFRAGDIETAINSPTGQPYIEVRMMRISLLIAYAVR